MTTVADFARFLEQFAPLHLAETWDNVGLLVGDAQHRVERSMTCLTLTAATVAEAVREKADLVVVHHPLPFKPLKRITTDALPGRHLWALIRGGVSVYSPHTAFDSAADGINAHLARKLGLRDARPLISNPANAANLGSGRFGNLAADQTLEEFARRVQTALAARHVQVIGDLDRPVRQIAVACGSGGSFLEIAAAAKCDLLVTGEANLHACYEAEALGIGLVLAGHYATERFHLEYLADVLIEQFPEVRVWASLDERDPGVWL
jgi:dinuclear metal center YbgI/SA1388 family protein